MSLASLRNSCAHIPGRSVVCYADKRTGVQRYRGLRTSFAGCEPGQNLVDATPKGAIDSRQEVIGLGPERKKARRLASL